MTHLFADGGRIVKSTRTDYSEYLGRSDTADIVRNLMKEQHKAMFVALRSGELDGHIGFDAGSPPPSIDGGREAVSVPQSISEPAPAPAPKDEAPASSAPETVASARPEAGEDEESESEGLEEDESPSSSAGSSAPPKESGSDRPYASPRPAAIFSGAPQPKGLFGDLGAIDEKSLDDAILSYLAEEPDESSGSSR